MIKVSKNGVPLSAIASITIDPLEPVFRRSKTEPAWVSPLRAMVHAGRRPKIALSPEEIGKLRANFLKEWPEVADFFPKK